MDSIQLAGFGSDEMTVFLSQHRVDETIKGRLTRLLEAKQRISDVETRIKRIDGDVGEISNDQRRLRDNIKALEGTREAKQLIARYVAKVNGQEDELEGLRKQKATLEIELQSRQKELQQSIEAMEIG